MIDADAMPEAAKDSFSLPHLLEKYPVRAAAATEDILSHHPAKTHNDIAFVRGDDPRSQKGKTQKTGRPSQGKERDLVGMGPGGRPDFKLTAKEMDLMAKIPQSLRGPKKIPLRPPRQIEPLMG